MHYNPGEILLYKGFSGSLSTVSTYSDEPDYEFNIETFEFDRCTDADRNNYTTVRIGTQVWMAENLKATKFRDGTLIPLVTENSGWHLNTTPAHCYYDNDHTNYIVYGGLYNWYTASNEMVCPEGWHVPTDRDWATLTTYLGNESIAGSVLKEAGTINWKEPNTGATNQTGFTALPEGYRDISGGFYGAGELGCWWSNSMIDVRAYNRMMSYSSINVMRSVNNKKYGMSVRCIKGNIPETVYDNDENPYTEIVIGNQVWMGENLKTTRLRDGTTIPLVTDNTSWEDLTGPGFCWYNNDNETNRKIYGALYNWHTVNTSKLCPAGWHVPTDEDWTTLTEYYGGLNLAGGALKESGTEHWKSPNNSSNESGFTARPGGRRDPSGGFYGIGEYGHWWTSTDILELNAYMRVMIFQNLNVTQTWLRKETGMSVRCLKNPPGTVEDYDGNFYTADTIGTQIWMGENLKTTHYSDGTSIPLITNNSEWANLITPGYCWYNNDETANKDTYGALYNWYTVNTGKLCPAGWHVPDYIEWLDILHTSGGEDIAGVKMKETGISHWSDPNTGATNESGFTALPAGSRIVEQGIYSGIFLGLKTAGYWWTSSPQVCADEWGGSYHLNYDNDDLGFVCRYRASGLSVRCVKDE